MDNYFTEKKISELVERHNWEMVPAKDGRKYKLRQKDRHHMTTQDFAATDEVARKFCVQPNDQVQP